MCFLPVVTKHSSLISWNTQEEINVTWAHRWQKQSTARYPSVRNILYSRVSDFYRRLYLFCLDSQSTYPRLKQVCFVFIDCAKSSLITVTLILIYCYYNPIARVNVESLHYLGFKFLFNVMWDTVLKLWLGFRHKNHLVRIRKGSRFDFKSPLWPPQTRRQLSPGLLVAHSHSWRYPDFPSKISVSRQEILPKTIQRCHAHKCRKSSLLNTGSAAFLPPSHNDSSPRLW